MARRTKEEKAKIAKRVAVASVLLIISSYVVREILKENLKELHDSLASAESQFRSELDQSTISLQIMNVQQQIENSRLQTGGKDLHRDFCSLITQDIPQARQARGHLDASLDGVSRLIDKFPSGVSDLRKLLDQMRQEVEKIDQRVEDMLKPRPNSDSLPFSNRTQPRRNLGQARRELQAEGARLEDAKGETIATETEMVTKYTKKEEEIRAFIAKLEAA
jgi:uncharacterized phage infection (PIP) family protein YhgE